MFTGEFRKLNPNASIKFFLAVTTVPSMREFDPRL